MQPSLTTPRVADLLDALYADAATNDPAARQAAKDAGATNGSEADFYRSPFLSYMAVNRDFGRLLYNLTRATQARTVVEFGTSFGVSTIYLASAVCDNGAGQVITTEFHPEKSARAQANLAEAGLDSWVEFRVGDALQTLASDLPGGIDLLFLDGAKGLYLEILKIVEPRLRTGAIIASDNTDHKGLEPFLDYIRTPANGYTSAAIQSPSHKGMKGHEITIRH